jgi:hypothetical protein
MGCTGGAELLRESNISSRLFSEHHARCEGRTQMLLDWNYCSKPATCVLAVLTSVLLITPLALMSLRKLSIVTG